MDFVKAYIELKNEAKQRATLAIHQQDVYAIQLAKIPDGTVSFAVVVELRKSPWEIASISVESSALREPKVVREGTPMEDLQMDASQKGETTIVVPIDLLVTREATIEFRVLLNGSQRQVLHVRFEEA